MAIKFLYTGNIDSSGMRFTITSTPRQFNAGVSGVGSEVNANLFVPPNTTEFNIYGYCPSTCTRRVRKYIHTYYDTKEGYIY